MPRPRQYPDDLRQQLLEAAAHLLATEGAAALTARRVSAEVGTSTSAIYRLWGSMPELVRALFLEGFRRFGDRLAQVEPTDDPLADLVALGRAYHDNAQANPEFYDVMFACPVPGFEPSADDAAFALSTLEVLIEAVGRCVSAGVLTGPAEDVAVELWAVNHGITSLGLQGMLGPPDQVAAHLQRALGATLTGFGADPEGRGQAEGTVPAKAATPSPVSSA